jgi:hypothetical protein
MKKIFQSVGIGIIAALMILSGALLTPAVSHAQQNVYWFLAGYAATADPCQNPFTTKNSVAVNISSATTTRLVALSTGKVVYVCNLSATVVGTSPTALLEYGTGATCGTGTTSISGTFAPVTGTLVKLEGQTSQVQTIASNSLCLVSGGTGPSIQGYLVYVQQ